jgi:predicted Zn-dependent protease
MTFPMKPSLFLFVGLLAVVGCTTVPETGRSQLMLVSPGEEAKMGLTTFEQIKQKEKISSDAKANAQVRRIGERIASSVGRELPNAQWEFVVFESDQVNAFALPGGKVGVYTGLIKLAQSDDELACVMGHEIAHVSSRHGAERASQTGLITKIGVLGAVVAEAKDVDPAKRNLALAAYGLAATGFYILPYSRIHETEADSIGLRFAAGAGYDPRASVTFWQRMSNANKGKPRPPEWFSTHPADDTRIQNLRSLAPQYMALYEASKTRFE